jgi:hypothetical protein
LYAFLLSHPTMVTNILLALGLLFVLAALAGTLKLLFMLMSVPAKWSQREAHRRIHARA